MTRGKFAGMFATLLLVVTAVTSSPLGAVTIFYQQYDFEPITALSPVTEPGWTHVQHNTYYTTTTAGWDDPRTEFYYQNADEPTQTTPTYNAMQRDWVGALINYPPTADPNTSIVFREIVPADASTVTFTIYRNSVDVYSPNFITTVQLSAGDTITPGVFSTVFTDPGSSNPADRLVPITGTVNFAPLATTRYLDVLFSFSGTKRLDGMSFVFPEPGSLSAIGLVGVVALRRRVRASKA